MLQGVNPPKVISNPMDFGTMMKKVKSKHYKSKREFKDDLELIWSNCYTYNAEVRRLVTDKIWCYLIEHQNHPLRQSVKRLRVKADRLLKYITDRKERTEPPIPSDLAVTHVARPKINGHVALNGRGHSHKRTPSFPSTIPKSGTPTIKLLTSVSVTNNASRGTLQFSDTPPITRTREGMALFWRLDHDIMQASPPGSSADTKPLLRKLQEFTSSVEDSSEQESDVQTPDSNPGDKRKAYVAPFLVIMATLSRNSNFTRILGTVSWTTDLVNGPGAICIMQFQLPSRETR